jgi:hypothetical protein
LYGHSGKNLYGIYGEGLLETDTWKEWTDKHFDNKDINSVHVSPFYKARIILHVPKNMPTDLSGFDYDVINDHTIAINYKGSNSSILYIPRGATIASVEAIQSYEKEYFAPIAIEPAPFTDCSTGMTDKILKTVIVLTIILVLILLLYRCLCRKEMVIVERLSENSVQNMQLPV